MAQMTIGALTDFPDGRGVEIESDEDRTVSGLLSSRNGAGTNAGGESGALAVGYDER